MPAVTTDILATITTDRAMPALADITTKRKALYSFFDKRVGVDQGTGPTWMVRVDQHNNAAGFSPGGLLPSPDTTTEVQASLSWGMYAATVRVQRAFMTRYADTPHLVDDYVNQQLASALGDMVDTIEADLKTGTGTQSNGSPGIVGLQAMFDDGTSTDTYAGISRGTYALWGTVVNDNSGGGDRSLTKAILEAGSDSLRFTNEADWDVGLFEKATLNTYTADTAAPTAQIAVVQGSGATFTSGWTNYSFEGKPLYPIPAMTTSRGYFLNMSDPVFSPYISILRPLLVDEPQLVGDDYLIQLTMELQLVCKNPPKMGIKFEEIT